MSPRVQAAVDFLREEYARSSDPWTIGYSGGKDSSLVVKLAFTALQRSRRRSHRVLVVYCDTGVEIPVVTSLVRRTLLGLQREASAYRLPIEVKVVKPMLRDRYFVKVIGRGYPPPTNKFRWCTDRLRIDPVQRLLTLRGRTNVVLLGIRRGESEQRDRTISRHGTSTYYFKQSGNPGTKILSPIVDFTVDDVWDALSIPTPPEALQVGTLASLYRDASGECPIIRDPAGSACSKGRFGCWTCSVVREDHSMTNLAARPEYAALRPLLEFRNWLVEFRDDPSARCKRRRNGQTGLGPLTLNARRVILERLLATQRQVPWRLISAQELRAIYALWKRDRQDPQYKQCELGAA